MATWRLLTEFLSTAGDSVRLTWAELDRIVGGLPPSAGNHRAWWSGKDRPHVNAWRSAGYTIADLRMGEEVTFVRAETTPAPAHGPSAGPLVESTPAPRQMAGPETLGSATTSADLVLVTCVKTKLSVPAAAKDLYTSDLFRKERAYAEAQGVPWFILSAEHGLVAPDEWLAPYERYLPKTPASYRDAWGHWVAERLDLLAGPLDGKVVEVHASAMYADAIAGWLTAKGATVAEPLRGLNIFDRRAWYDYVPGAATSRPSPKHDQADRFVELLLDRTRAVTPDDFLATAGAGLRGPGLYSWWVDTPGAADLTAGLGEGIKPGLIYAGLAGATRWPSGKRSGNTLWSRIAGMHLGSNHDLSTFRRTLGAALAEARGWTTIDEPALTVWMKEHLHVIAVPFAEPDTLGRLEGDVLADLDPPLNLKGMEVTAVRSRLTTLRRNHTKRRTGRSRGGRQDE